MLALRFGKQKTSINNRSDLLLNSISHFATFVFEMHTDLITVQVVINAPINHVWNCFTQPQHVTQWNFASPDWHCPSAENKLEVGGKFTYTMATKDGSFSFDFWGIFTQIESEKLLKIKLGDERIMDIRFEESNNKTIVTEHFEPEKQNPEEMQKSGWQAILDNFKTYCEQVD